MRRFAIALLSATAMSVVGANAADLSVMTPIYKAPPPVAPYNWTGFYVGGNVGYGWGATTGDLSSFDPAFNAAVAAGGTPGSLGTKASGALGGVQFGYNWQVGAMLLGAEADIQASGVDNTSTVNFAGGGGILPSTSTGQENLKWFGTVRLRGGVLVTPRVLLYATGGFAYGGVSNSATNVFTPAAAGNFSGSNSETRSGWTAGGGAEWAFADGWSVRGEYLYVDLGSTNVRMLDPVNFPGTFADYTFKHRYNIARVGLNYKF
jgi:outer membrane immunogenic protein